MQIDVSQTEQTKAGRVAAVSAVRVAAVRVEGGDSGDGQERLWTEQWGSREGSGGGGWFPNSCND